MARSDHDRADGLVGKHLLGGRRRPLEGEADACVGGAQAACARDRGQLCPRLLEGWHERRACEVACADEADSYGVTAGTGARRTGISGARLWRLSLVLEQNAERARLAARKRGVRVR